MATIFDIQADFITVCLMINEKEQLNESIISVNIDVRIQDLHKATTVYVWKRSSKIVFEPPHDKTNKMTVRPAKTPISLCIRPVWSESSLSAWRKLGSLATHWAQAKTLIRLGGCPGWSSLGAQATLLVLTWGGSFFPLLAPGQLLCIFRTISASGFHTPLGEMTISKLTT